MGWLRPAAFTVIPRRSPLDLVRLWCGRWLARRPSTKQDLDESARARPCMADSPRRAMCPSVAVNDCRHRRLSLDHGGKAAAPGRDASSPSQRCRLAVIPTRYPASHVGGRGSMVSAFKCSACGDDWSCDRAAKTRELCQTHYMQQWQGRPLAPIRPPGTKSCSFADCEAVAVSRGLCNAHRYQKEIGIELRPVNRTRYNGAKCAVGDCQAEAKKKSMCGKHYQIERRKAMPPCSFDGCDRPLDDKNLKLCSGHRSQISRGQELMPLFAPRGSLAKDGMKKCHGCGVLRPVGDYSVRAASADGRQNRCINCAINRKLAKYSINRTQYEMLLEAQGGGCAICGTRQCSSGNRLAVDHDHSCCPGERSCGRCIRGLLCQNCNARGLGWYEALPPALRTFDFLNSYLNEPPARKVLGADEVTGA
ncbi:endonuclease domain-containing protein [Streptomyces sp. NPDC003362]